MLCIVTEASSGEFLGLGLGLGFRISHLDLPNTRALNLINLNPLPKTPKPITVNVKLTVLRSSRTGFSIHLGHSSRIAGFMRCATSELLVGSGFLMPNLTCLP